MRRPVVRTSSWALGCVRARTQSALSEQLLDNLPVGKFVAMFWTKLRLRPVSRRPHGEVESGEGIVRKHRAGKDFEAYAEWLAGPGGRSWRASRAPA